MDHPPRLDPRRAIPPPPARPAWWPHVPAALRRALTIPDPNAVYATDFAAVEIDLDAVADLVPDAPPETAAIQLVAWDRGWLALPLVWVQAEDGADGAVLVVDVPHGVLLPRPLPAAWQAALHQVLARWLDDAATLANWLAPPPDPAAP